MRAALILALVATCTAVPTGAAVGPWASHPEVQVRLVAPWDAAPIAGAPERALRLGVELVLAPRWHAYWKNSGDAGFAPALVMKTPQIEGAELLFPAPRRFELRGGLVAFGYEETVIYPVRATLAPGAAGTLSIRASFDQVVCAEECVPYRDALTLDLPLVDAPREDVDTTRRLAAFESRLPREATAVALGTSATLRQQSDGTRTLDLVLGAPSEPGAMLFLLPDAQYQPGRPERGMEGGNTRFRVPLTARTAPAPSLAATEFHWTVTGLLLAGRESAVEGATTAQPAQRSAFPGIVLWPLAGAALVALAVWLYSRAGSR